MSELSELKKQYERLGAEIEKLEQETKPWPQVGDEYWYLDDYGETHAELYDNAFIDNYRIATGNCHRTEAEAIAYHEWQTDPRVVARGMIERMEGFDPFGEVMLSCNTGGNNVRTINAFGDARRFGGLLFKNYGFAELVIEKFGEDFVSVALGGITDKEEGSRIVREAMGK